MTNAQLRRDSKRHRALVNRLVKVSLGISPLKEADLFATVHYLTEIDRRSPTDQAKPPLYAVIDALLTEVMHTYRRRREKTWAAA